MKLNAGMVDAFDLRHAFAVALSGAPADNEDTDADDTGETVDGSTGQDQGDHDGAQDSEDDQDDAGEDVKNPRLKKLSEEAARRRQEAKAQRKRAEEAEGTTRELRCEIAFLRGAAAAGITDPDAAWKLADRTGLGVDDNGKVTGIETLVEKLVDRYPYLLEVDDDDEGYLPLTSSGKSQNGKSGPAHSSKEILYKKFPALRRARS